MLNLARNVCAFLTRPCFVLRRFHFPSLDPAFDHLDAPVERICGVDIPMPYAKGLEALALPKLQDILVAARRTLQRGNKKL